MRSKLSVSELRLHRYWWRMLETKCFVDNFKMLMTVLVISVTNISKLSPTHFVSNIRHQYRCSRKRECNRSVGIGWSQTLFQRKTKISNIFCIFGCYWIFEKFQNRISKLKIEIFQKDLFSFDSNFDFRFFFGIKSENRHLWMSLYLLILMRYRWENLQTVDWNWICSRQIIENVFIQPYSSMSHDSLTMSHKLWLIIRLNPGILKIFELCEWKAQIIELQKSSEMIPNTII